jgi:hypothetical protein
VHLLCACRLVARPLAPLLVPLVPCADSFSTHLTPSSPYFTNPSPCSLWVNCPTSKPSCAAATLKRMPWPNSTCPPDLYRQDRVQIPSASRARPTSALAIYRLRHITLSDSAGFARRWPASKHPHHPPSPLPTRDSFNQHRIHGLVPTSYVRSPTTPDTDDQ